MNGSDVLAALALLVSCVSAWVAYRATTNSRALAAYDRSTDLFLKVNDALISHPEVRPYFYDNKPLDETDPAKPLVEAVAELILDVFEWIWYRGGLSPRNYVGWREYIIEMVDKSDVLCAYHTKNPQWHPAVDNLLKSRPRPPRDSR
ncbi:hypothetical protein AB0J80_21660 [Actinoplanes sp. NPDC049548]|uniref:hypothetical protein n=1 Tax=Actinoplanes sp. NPDC049548 TaxID=3155152 RepID=UPI0034332B1B